jgi:hypothetical protein
MSAVESSRPKIDFIALLVGKRTDDNEDEVDNGPNDKTAAGQQLQESGPDFANVKPMKAEQAEKETQQGRRQNPLAGYGEGSALRRAAKRTSKRAFVNFFAAASTIDHHQNSMKKGLAKPSPQGS